jgi:Winged helix-turn helix
LLRVTVSLLPDYPRLIWFKMRLAEPTLNSRSDEVRCKERERDRHVDLADAASLTSRNVFRGCFCVSCKLIEPNGVRLERRARMLLHEEFGLSVSDDTVYRALKVGFSHVSARPKAYKQDADAVEAFKKTFPPAWRRFARNLRPAHQ